MTKLTKKEGISGEAFIFMGKSGCGKGTQVELFKEKLKEKSNVQTFHVETGTFFREFIKGNSYSQVLSKKTVEAGGLMPGSYAIYLWVDYLVKNFTGKENLLFDGASRKLSEAILLEETLRFYGIKRYKVVYINVGDKWSHDRLFARGRKDDSEEGIKTRMAWFQKDVMPCIEFFKNDSNCDFYDINGEQTIEEVHKEIVKKVFKE